MSLISDVMGGTVDMERVHCLVIRQAKILLKWKLENSNVGERCLSGQRLTSLIGNLINQLVYTGRN